MYKTEDEFVRGQHNAEEKAACCCDFWQTEIDHIFEQRLAEAAGSLGERPQRSKPAPVLPSYVDLIEQKMALEREVAALREENKRLREDRDSWRHGLAKALLAWSEYDLSQADRLAILYFDTWECVKVEAALGQKG